MEKSELKSKLTPYNNEVKELIQYKYKIKIMFKSKTLETAMKRFNRLWDKKDELPQIIHDF